MRRTCLAAALAAAGCFAGAAPLHPVPDPGLLISTVVKADLVDPQITLCTYDGACLAETPREASPSLFAQAPPSARHKMIARELLPAGAVWLLAARTDQGLPFNSTAVVPKHRALGEPAHTGGTPFDLLSAPDSVHAGAMFLIGTCLFLVSISLGLAAKVPEQPPAADSGEFWIPDAQLLPRIVSSPSAPAGTPASVVSSSA